MAQQRLSEVGFAPVERALGRPVPAYYADFYRHHGEELAAEFGCLLATVDEFVEVNLFHAREARIAPHDHWPADWFIVASSDADVWVVHANKTPPGVWLWSHETAEIEQVAPSLEDWLRAERAENERDRREPSEYRRPGEMVPEPYFRIPTAAGRAEVAAVFGLEAPLNHWRGGYWEWNVNQTPAECVRVYREHALGDDARYSLGEILAHCLEQQEFSHRHFYVQGIGEVWPAAAALFESAPALHASTVYSWSGQGKAESANRHSIAPLMEAVWERIRHEIPDRPVVPDAAWRTTTVLSLARQMRTTGDYCAMPILADALQDTGCAEETVLAHCRRPGPHVRGCWVIALLLGP